jgi:hypothetical protein
VKNLLLESRVGVRHSIFTSQHFPHEHRNPEPLACRLSLEQLLLALQLTCITKSGYEPGR